VGVIETTMIARDPASKELMSRNLLPVPLQYAIMYLGSLAEIVGAVGMLKAHNWARYLYVVSGLSAIVIVLGISAIDRTALIRPFVIYAVQVLFLFRPKANEYFRQKTS